MTKTINGWDGASVCSHCKFYKREDGTGGLCFRYPPVVVTDEEGAPWMMRPQVEVDEQSCGEFKGVN